MLPRKATARIESLATMFKSIAIIGPRQSGKTTLVKALFKQKPYVSLENLDTRNFALQDPRGFLDQYPNGAVFDEIQRVPELFSYLQEYIDATTQQAKYILTGSNNFLLQQNISQTLAGRIAYVELLPFSLEELGTIHAQSTSDNQLLFTGFYPPIHDQQIAAQEWYSQYIKTYIERDIRQLKNISDLLVFERFMRLLAGRNGQELNKAALGIEVGVDAKTIDAWLSILQTSYLLFLLPPFYNNYNKTVVKRPKVYFIDTGLVCNLLGIYNSAQLDLHPLRGSLFEGLVIAELHKKSSQEGGKVKLFYWRDKSGNEVDVIIDTGMNRIPIEIKAGKTIQSDYFKGLNYWNALRKEEGGMVLYGGDQQQQRSNNTAVLNWKNYLLETTNF